MVIELHDAEDAKLLTLARANRARAGSNEGAAVRDTDGRTYSAANVDLPSLQLSAIQVAVAMASSSGVQGLEAAVVVCDGLGISQADVDAVRDLGGTGRSIFRADADGNVLDSMTT